MALLEDIAKGASPAGVMTGIGAVLLAPFLAPAVSQVLRPAAKGVMRTGITLYRSVVEPISGAVGDLIAEAQLELAASPTASAPAADAVKTAPPERPKRRSARTKRTP